MSWKKLQRGRVVTWIGVVAELVPDGLRLSLAEPFVQDLCAKVDAALGAKATAVRDLRQLVGKAEWAAGIVPHMKAILTPLWAAAADAPAGLVGRARIVHSLKWLQAFLRRRRGTIERVYRVGEKEMPTKVVLEFDASPWGYGGVLYKNGHPAAFYAEPISKEDVVRFSIEVGQAKHQALVETIAILIGLRLWAAELASGKWSVYVRSDSSAALDATFKLRSPDPRINAVVREISLDLAEGRYDIQFVEHLPGRCNVVADCLSRYFQPGGSQDTPALLRQAARGKPAVRDARWWATALDPTDADDGATVPRAPSSQAASRLLTGGAGPASGC